MSEPLVLAAAVRTPIGKFGGALAPLSAADLGAAAATACLERAKLSPEVRMGTIILSILVGHTAWHWMIERGQALSRYSWPEMTFATAASGLRWLMAGVALAGLMWLISLLLQRVNFQNASSRRTEP